MLLFIDNSDEDDVDPSSELPPGVTDEDVELFKQAQEKAQEALLEVSSLFALMCSRHNKAQLAKGRDLLLSISTLRTRRKVCSNMYCCK